MKPKKPLPKNETFTGKNQNIHLSKGLIKPVISVLVLCLLTFITFYGAFDNSFVNWDDQVYVEEQPLVILENTRIAQLSSGNHDFSCFTSTQGY